jgi:hypothetical protein
MEHWGLIQTAEDQSTQTGLVPNWDFFSGANVHGLNFCSNIILSDSRLMVRDNVLLGEKF